MADCFSQQTARKSLMGDDLPSWLYGPAFWPLISRAMSLISLTLKKISTKLDDLSCHAGVCTRALPCTSGCSRGCKSLRIVTKHWLWRLWAWPPGEFANSVKRASGRLHCTQFVTAKAQDVPIPGIPGQDQLFHGHLSQRRIASTPRGLAQPTMLGLNPHTSTGQLLLAGVAFTRALKKRSQMDALWCENYRFIRCATFLSACRPQQFPSSGSTTLEGKCTGGIARNSSTARLPLRGPVLCSQSCPLSPRSTGKSTYFLLRSQCQRSAPRTKHPYPSRGETFTQSLYPKTTS